MNVQEWIVSLSAAAIPPEAQHQLRRCILDGIGVAIAGSVSASARIAADFAASIGRPGPATVLATGEGLSLPPAVFANAVAANAWDFDDGYRLAKGHPGAFVIMPALNAAEAWGAEDLFVALAAGYEIALRAAVATHRTYHHYHASGSWGALGTAACVGRLRGLSAPQMREALGLAEYHAALAPIERCLGAPGMTKDGIGWGAFAGACAVELAARGFTSNPSLFEDPANQDLMADLGEKWRLRDLYFKPYACCRWAQPAVEAALALRSQIGLQATEIAHVVVHTVREATELYAGLPTNEEEAQYSVVWPVAMAFLYGDVSVVHICESALQDASAQRLASQISLVVDPALQERFPAECLAWLEVHTRQGQILRSSVTAARGDPHLALSDEELEAKFRRLVAPLLGPKTESLLTAIQSVTEPHGPARLVKDIKDCAAHIGAGAAFSARRENFPE